MAIGKALKIGAAVLGAAGGVAGVANTVVNVVEEINYENQHIITAVDTYWINGVEVTEDQWLAFNTNTESTSIYYGAVTDINNFNLTDLTAVNLVDSTGEYNFHVDAGDLETPALQHVVFAVPNSYSVVEWKEATFSIMSNVGMVSKGDYSVYYNKTAIIDADLGGSDYTVTFVQ